MIHLSFINHDNDFDVTVGVSIRFDEIEDMINKQEKLLSDKEKNNTSTIGVELGNLTEGKQKRWTVTNQNDIDIVSNEIYGMIQKVAIPYIDKYSNMDNVFELCARDDQEVLIHSPFDYKRALIAVSLAKILNKKENFNELVQAKSNYLRERNTYELDLFLQFVEEIK